MDLVVGFEAFKKKIEYELIPKKALAFSIKQLYELIKSGTNLYTALDIIIDLQDLKPLKEAYEEVKKDIQMGKPLHKAFDRKPFPEILPNMLYAAETSENLESVFKTTVEFLDNIDSYKSKIISKAVYPSIVMVFSIVAVLISVNYVVPRIKDVLSSFGAKLPMITIILMYIAKFIVFMLYISPIIVLGFLLKERIFSKQKIDYFYTRMPFFGKLLLYFELSKFLYAMSLMLSSNSSMGISIRVATQTISNSYIKQRLSSLEQDIYHGISFSQSIAKTGLFKKSVISVIKNGEYTGDLTHALKTAYTIYDQLLNKLINTFVSSLEPIATLIIGALVSFIVLSIMLPIIDISSSVH